MKATSAIATGATWREALDGALAQLELEPNAPADLALIFAGADYVADYPQLLAEAQRALGARLLVGCSGQGVIGLDREVEHEPAISILACSLPGAELRAFHLRQEELPESSAGWAERTGLAPEDVNAWLLLADPFSLDPETLIEGLSAAYPEAPLVGGLASGDLRRQETHLFLNGEVLEEGALAVALGGAYTVHSVVSQGAEPIGEPWTITGAQGNLVESLGMRPALEILVETVQALPPEMQERARGNLLVGLAMNEYRDEFHRGDFLIRNLMGIDRESGLIAISGLPRTGQTLQFQLRDPNAADSELAELLLRAGDELGRNQPVGALLCSCNGRGLGMFGAPHHDARAVRERFGPLPVAGFFCNGEIGPVAGKPFVHGFTASLALIVRKGDPARETSA